VKCVVAANVQELAECAAQVAAGSIRQAITMSIRQILEARTIVCAGLDSRTAEAVAAALPGPLTPGVPASILRRRGSATIYLDPESAGRLKEPSSKGP
jgi:6-phosphogluconolactonase/glucosamine-6-phosphate isomerase/deaminase